MRGSPPAHRTPRPCLRTTGQNWHGTLYPRGAMTSRSNRLLGPDTRPCVQKRVIVTHLWFKYVLLKKISNSKNSLSMSRVTCSKMVNVYFKLLCYIYELWSSADDAVTSRSNRLLGPDTRPCVQKRVIVTHLWFKYVLLKKISNSKNSLSMSRVTCSKMVNVYFKLLCYIYELWSSADDQLSLVPRA